MSSRPLLGLLITCTALALPPAAQAGILVSGSAGHGWQPFVAPTEGGNPYWDQPSSDGSQYNVGYYLTKTGGYAGHPTLGKDSPALAVGDLQYWGSHASPHTADPLQIFQASGTVPTKLYLTFAGHYGINELGYYLTTDPGTLNPIFSSGEYYGTGPNYPVSATFTPGADFGLYLKTSSGEVYYSDASLNPAGDQDHQHFAVFRQSNGKLWIGVEDLKFDPLEKTGDYNDLIITMESIEEAPEPTTLALAGCGLLCLAFGNRRRLCRGMPPADRLAV